MCKQKSIIEKFSNAHVSILKKKLPGNATSLKVIDKFKKKLF